MRRLSRIILKAGRKRRRVEYLKYKEVARQLAKSKIEHYNSLYGFRVNRIAIKNSRSRWGSCSKKGNLNFNYKIVLLPQKMSDYIIVHELCHLGEFNHSPNFWKLVALAVPDYLKVRQMFKEFRL